MIPNAIEREILIEAPVEVVWGVVTESEQISRWFCDEARIDAHPGGEGTLTWEEYGTVQLRVERVERPHRFAFRWIYPEGDEPRAGNSLLVEFTLSPQGGGTRLHVVESGLAELDWDQDRKTDYAAEHEQGWEQHLGALGSYVSEQRQVSAH